MKKILGISLIAVMAAMPLMANAEVVPGDPGETAATPVQAEYAPGYPLAQANTLKDGKMATAGYVKGAYNAAIKAVNRVSADTATALSGKQDTISDLSDIRSGAEAGTSAVTAIGDMTELEVEDADTLVEAINAIKTATDSALTASSLEDYATTDDVADAINSATASTTVGVVTTWGTDAESEIVLTGSVAVAAAASSAASSGL